MKSIIVQIFGIYQPLTTDLPVLDGSGTIQVYNVIPSGFAGVDWQWIAGVFLFGIVLYSLFRIIGTILKG